MITVYPTHLLRLGDIVVNHGMRILLDKPPTIREMEPRHGGNRVKVYSWSGLVLNPITAAVRYRIPVGWLYDIDHHDGTRWVRSTEPRWTVQGNHLARWGIEKEHEIGA